MPRVFVCPTRTEARVHDAVRTLVARMNIVVVEPQHTRTHAVCCGDSFFGLVTDAEIKEQMARRAGEMPRRDVVVYCVSCVKSMHIGGRSPRYLVDLLFGEATSAGTFEPAAWHAELDAFIAAH
jgi:Fe-S oxidoreductase